MNITYDDAKDAANLAKHGVSLALVHKLEWALLLVKPDVRTDYGELRMIGYAPIADHARYRGQQTPHNTHDRQSAHNQSCAAHRNRCEHQA